MFADVHTIIWNINNMINYKSSELRDILQRLNYKIHLDTELNIIMPCLDISPIKRLSCLEPVGVMLYTVIF
jgi:hypothetical protein